ncbi:MAG: hypothetical protein AAGJ28_00395 [Pseudomonadota bacterium]
MKGLPLPLDQFGLALAASIGFAGSTWAFRRALDTGDHRWLISATALLILSYLPYLALLGQSMSATIVTTSMMSQILALAIAFGVYGEPITLMRGLGLFAAVLAIAAFTLPTSTGS